MHICRAPMAAMVFASCMPAAALCQATANPTAGAEDAFGFRKGDESVGIYDEVSVRGFNLEVAGNYRVNGTYFVKNSGVSTFFLDSTTIRIGHNTLNARLPGPLGLVDYRLRDPSKGEHSLLTIERDANGGLHSDVHLKHRSSDDRASYSLGLGLVANLSNEQGGDGGRSMLLGGAMRQDLGPARARLFFGEYRYERPNKFRVIPGDELPPSIERGRFLGQTWSEEKGQRRIAGMLLDVGESASFGAGATFVFSQEDPTRGYRQFLDDLRPDGSSRVRMLVIPHQRSTSWSGEARVHRQWLGRATKQRIDLMVRGRRSRARFGGSRMADLGRAPFGEPAAAVPEPSFPENIRYSHDAVDQWGIGASWRAIFGDRLSVNAGLLKTHYAKGVEPAAGARRQSKASPLLYNAGASLGITGKLDVYATYSRGLEEAGVAPANAINRDAVLDAVQATQREVGLRFRGTEKLNLALGAFDTRKPYIGLDGRTGIYGELGQVRHRGIELSVAGSPTPGLSMVAGGALLSPRISGTLVDDGQIGDRPVAVPRLRAIANIDYALPGISGLSVDVGLTHVSSRPVRSLPGGGGEQLSVPSITTANAGLRYRFRIGSQPLIARAQLLNIANRFRWDVDSSETLSYTAGRQWRLLLTAEL